MTQGHRLTVNTVMQGVCRTCAAYTGSRDIVYGVTVSVVRRVWREWSSGGLVYQHAPLHPRRRGSEVSSAEGAAGGTIKEQGYNTRR